MAMNWLSAGLLASAVLAAVAFGADEAAANGDREKGAALAERLCASCHAVGASGESAHADAPPLRVIAARWPVEYLEEALAEGIMVGHSDMPEFELHPDRIADLLAYIDSLSK